MNNDSCLLKKLKRVRKQKKKKKRKTQNTKRRSNNFYPNRTLMSKNIFGITNQSLLGFDVIDEESNESYSI